MKVKRLNRKANLFDPLLIVIILFVSAIIITILMVVTGNLEINFQDLFKDYPTSKNVIAETHEAINLFDYTFVILLVMLIINSLISAFFIRSHPVFFIVSTILLFIFVIPAAVLSNAFDKYEHNPKVAAVSSDFQIISYFIGKLPIILVVTMILVMIVLFIYKPGQTDFYG